MRLITYRMYVIKREILATECEYIMDVVENFETLCHYIEKLIETDPTLKRGSTAIFESMFRPGYCIRVLHNSEEEICVEHYKFVKEPSKQLTWTFPSKS
jgi:hypothetical protein